ncbi:MAG TPA: beta-N-acetylhexosaminidase [Clostridiales bacterium]|nr:beta-N-acetylhexosaminidase [Clostridiales bacterium]
MHAKKEDCLRVCFMENKAEIGYAEPVQFFRGLSLLVLHCNRGEKDFSITEKPCFRKDGVMFDCSRNAVLTVDAIKFFIRKMALMGLNLGMMYTEDTYEVPEYPYFGYMRGIYTFDELKEADDYAALFGIELMPCIQTLAHLERAMRWPKMQYLKDTEEVLMVGEEASYEFIENMLKAATAPYRSKRIHIGMDEAMDLGLGRYLKKNGYRASTDIISHHLKRVREILKKLGLEAMMWSDMYFRIASPSHSYYDLKNPIPQSVIDNAPDDISLVYWDYYNEDESVLSGMIKQHRRFKADTCFAGGIWTWCGPATDYDKSINTTVAALDQCRKLGVSEVFATAWGDNGAEANFLTVLYGLQLYAEMNYTGEYNPKELADRFNITCRTDAECFTNLTMFNSMPGMEPLGGRPVNAAKFMLYQDPLIPLFEKDMEGFELDSHYYKLAEQYKIYADEYPEYELLFKYYADLARALSLKCRWHGRAADCVRNRDKKQAVSLVDSVPEIVSAIRDLKNTWLSLWDSTNKPYGFEIIDLRLGGIVSRFETAQLKMKQFADGNIDDIPELSSEKLLYTKYDNGKMIGSYVWSEIASACKTY